MLTAPFDSGRRRSRAGRPAPSAPPSCSRFSRDARSRSTRNATPMSLTMWWPASGMRARMQRTVLPDRDVGRRVPDVDQHDAVFLLLQQHRTGGHHVRRHAADGASSSRTAGSSADAAASQERAAPAPKPLPTKAVRTPNAEVIVQDELNRHHVERRQPGGGRSCVALSAAGHLRLDDTEGTLLTPNDGSEQRPPTRRHVEPRTASRPTKRGLFNAARSARHAVDTEHLGVRRQAPSSARAVAQISTPYVVGRPT